MKPDQQASTMLINCLYYTGNKPMAHELGLYICEKILEQKLKADDRIYWILVKEEIYKSNR